MALSVKQKTEGNCLTIFQRIANNDQTAVAECMNAYGNLIWAIAKKMSVSPEAAENAVRAIFLDIWRCAARFEHTELNDFEFITKIAQRNLITHSKQLKETI